LVSAFVVFAGIEGPSVFELEDFLLDVGGLVVLGVAGVHLLEVEFVEAVLAVGQDLLLVQELSRGRVTSSILSSSR
jgi:hypothetical protein